MTRYKDYLAHYGIKKMKWGKRNGPPYPLTDLQRSSDEVKANPTSISAKKLAKIGKDNRFNKTGATGGAIGKSKSEKDDGKTYEPDIKESRLTKFADKYKDQRESNLSSKSSSSASEETKTKKSSGLTAEERARREAERQQDRAERKARQAQRDKEREEDRAERKARQAQRDKEHEEDRAYKLAQRAEKEAAKKAKENSKFFTDPEIKIGSGVSSEKGKRAVNDLLSSWMSNPLSSESKRYRERAIRIIKGILFGSLKELKTKKK